MWIDFLMRQFEAASERDTLVFRGTAYSYGWLRQRVQASLGQLASLGVVEGSVVMLEADFSPASVALLLALVEQGCIVVPLAGSIEAKKAEFTAIAEGETRLRIADDETVSAEPLGSRVRHPLLLRLRAERHPGLVLFSSGSTGRSKAAVHDFAPILEKFHTPRHAKRMISFLLFDHIGGLNTLFYCLSNAGCLITVDDRSPDRVCDAIARHRAQVLPTSPTFLGLLLISEAYRHHDLGSLELITYGTEVMPESILERLHRILPKVELLQTYGLSEVGILRSKSRSSDSLWVRIGGEGFETRVVDRLLEIKARSAMLGYLNAPSPFTADGWFRTGDEVEVDGDWLRILGRKSELINIGGEKAYPAEIESVLLQMDGVLEVTVVGEPNPITGMIVKAMVRLASGEDPASFRARLRPFCRTRLKPYMIPQKIVVVTDAMHGDRFKKVRQGLV